VSMNVFDGDGQSVGEYSRLILITKKGQIFIEHDNAGLQVTGTGFGARFQAATEDKYRELGVNAIFRGCGQFVGRYEGARSEFDFRDENMRSIFAQAFCAYLQENGVESVSIDSESGISVQDLPSRITIPQDMLKVTADRSVIAIKMERKDRAKEPPREFQTVIEHKKTYPADKAGKAFFLDEGSEAKKNIDPTVDYRQHSVGKWFGIKRLT
ncbi:MAG: hypothetical protein QF815_03660, partial [Candidatus Peribacteraceae bacterium]|nr:hypothetical protein [Candidatus Peribacteraceae bacterium]